MEGSLPSSSTAPAITHVYSLVQRRMRSLTEVLNFRQEHGGLDVNGLTVSVADVRTLEQQQFSTPSNPSRLPQLTDDEVEEQTVRAWKGLCDVLARHDKIDNRANDTRTFRLAIAKERAGQQDNWKEKERLYMALTDPALSSPESRLRSTVALILHLDIGVFLQEVCKVEALRSKRIRRSKYLDDNLQQTRKAIAEKFDMMVVDHFACAVPLSSLQPSPTSAVVDENAGSCPICQNSYTDLTNFAATDLMADYPVRIKYCGHIVGKSCLETWMDTPKVDPAKYPDRTCPLCRVKIEGVEAPPIPQTLQIHLRSNRRGWETTRELMDSYGLALDEVHEAVIACISRSIACGQLLKEARRQKSNGDASVEENEKILTKRLEELAAEIRAWGFRGASPWRAISVEWLNSGVVRKD